MVARAIWGDAAGALASLSQAVATQDRLIAQGIPIGVLRLTPDSTLSSAKVPLNDGTSFLTFLFTAKTAADEGRVFLDLDYRISELEYDLGSLPGIEGYQASSWLSFVCPIDESDERYGTPLGQVEIPVPLRAYPTPPSLVAQQVVQPSPRQLADVKLWQYAYTYEHLDAAQDTIETGVRYNLPPTKGPMSARALAAGAPPARVRLNGKGWRDVAAWAGPWPVDEKWWDESVHRRRARFQVALADGTAHLLSLEEGRWQLEATYD
jgi:hypothetical protein